MVEKNALARRIKTNRHLYKKKKQKIQNQMLNIRGGLRNKWGVQSTIKTELEDIFRGTINFFGRQLVPRFDNADRKGKLAA